MKPAQVSLVLLLLSGQVFAHRLDEYLQATMISLGKDRIAVEMRLSPGVAVAPFVIATIDRDGDGAISSQEETACVRQVLDNVSMSLDGDVLALHLVSKMFAGVKDMREGRGEILLEFFADIPRQGIGARKLLFENNYQRQIGAYLVNSTVPSDPDIRITAQARNFQQSSYRLDYSQARASSRPLSLASWSGQRAWLIALAVLITTRCTFLWRQRETRRGPI
jgi:hypothetical protein